MRIGVDTGGTFTDVVRRDASGRLRVYKLLSTPAAPWKAIAGGVDEVRGEVGRPAIVHGTTVATNALLERKGARVAFVTTAGFEDLLFLRRQNRPDLYALDVELTPPLVDADGCFGVAERILRDGTVERPLGASAVESIVEAVEDFDSVAICLLHAYANDAHEVALADAIGRAHPELHVSTSSSVLREFREYERASATTINAFVGPSMGDYLGRLEEEIANERIEVLQSSGGRMDVESAAEFPVHTVLSGPAGGVVGGLAAGREAGFDRVITFDMGGTSTDVSLCDGEFSLTSESEIDGLPLRVPVVDIYTVGAGGGSIARRDRGGALRVGPQSAGADPGPAAYGLGGDRPTVTDAHVVLGRLRPDAFLGGGLELDADAARAAVGRLAHELGLDLRDAARGVLDVADASMVRAIKVISLERGFDPRTFTLVSFGGAGGLHACRLAEALDLPRVVVPRHPGLLSAYGMLHAASHRLFSQTVLEPFRIDRLASALETLHRRALEQGGRQPDVWSASADLRYDGQSFEINVDVDWSPGDDASDPCDAFETRHEELYGYVADRRIELVTVRLTARTEVDEVGGSSVADESPSPAARTSDRIGFAHGDVEATVVGRRSLGPDERLAGPAVVTEYSGTTVVPDGWEARIVSGHMVLERGGGR